MIKFIIPGYVCGKQRSRGRHIKTKDNSEFNINYTPKKTVNYETLIQELFYIKYKNHGLILDAISMTINAYYPIPKSISKKKRELMLSGEIRPTVRPDFDNVEKIFADALSGIAYKNDNQVVDSEFHKYYSDNPRTEITIYKLSEIQNG